MKFFIIKTQTIAVNQIRKLKGLLITSTFLILSLYPPASYTQTLVWEENFTGTELNEDVWTFDFGDGCERGLCGWGNGELQYYTSRTDNARVENGNLIIEAKREIFGNKPFTSARLKTEGRVHFTYGTLEARIKMPDLANGLWPAFWMLGTTGTWPQNGEIDIVEMGSAAAIQEAMINRKAGAAVHWSYNGSQADYGTDYDNATDLNDGYHIYKMTWTPETIKMFIDDIEYFVIDISDIEGNSMEEFHIPHFIILNLAVGGTYTGIMSPEGITAPMPAQMLVDYIKLYQNNADQLYLGSNNAESGSFGVYTENTPVNNELVYGTNADLFIWNNMTPNSASAYEGDEALSFNISAGQWYGMGIATDYVNLSNFYEGALNLHMKTTSTENFRIGISTGHGDSWIELVNGGEQFGLVRDGNWHEVSVPLSTFQNLDLNSVKQAFMLTGNPPGSNLELAIDNIYYSGGGSSNLLPEVQLTSPTLGSEFALGSPILINVSAIDADGSIDKIEFFINSNKIGEDLNPPFSYIWTASSPGDYEITARATDNSNASSTSSAVSISIIDNGDYVSIPGLLQAEDFTTMNGIQTEGTNDNGGGLNVGWIDAGDWMDYDINVQEAGTYTVDLRVASQSGGGELNLRSGEQTLAIESVPSTGGWQNWTTISTTVNLNSGNQTLRLYSSSAGWNINWMQFSPEPDGNNSSCTFSATTGDYTAQVSEDSSNPTLTFTPSRSGVGSPTAILYYGTSATEGLPGYPVSANVPFEINAAQGQTIYFYYTYSVPEGGERNTADSRHSFTVGNCNYVNSQANSVDFSLTQEITVKQDMLEALNLFPNPTRGFVTVADKFVGGSMDLINSLGKRVAVIQINSQDIDLSSFPPGIYTLHLINNGQRATTKLIRQ